MWEAAKRPLPMCVERLRLIFGAKKETPYQMTESLWCSASYTEFFARASIANTSPAWVTRASLNVAPKAMGEGKTVALPALATPWEPSLHQAN